MTHDRPLRVNWFWKVLGDEGTCYGPFTSCEEATAAAAVRMAADESEDA